MTRLPVNATSEAHAREIAEHAAATLPAKGMTLTVGPLIEVESPARAFSKVALQEEHAKPADLQTFVFEAEVARS